MSERRGIKWTNRQQAQPLAPIAGPRTGAGGNPIIGASFFVVPGPEWLGDAVGNKGPAEAGHDGWRKWRVLLSLVDALSKSSAKSLLPSPLYEDLGVEDVFGGGGSGDVLM